MAEEKPTPPSQVQTPPVQNPTPPFIPAIETHGATGSPHHATRDYIPHDYKRK